MINNIGKGLLVGLVSMLFVSCGGGGGGTISSTPFSTISGTISDGPIENAKICITDVELDNEYCPTYTDANGYYSFDYIVENGKQYLITAYGSDGIGFTTYDRKDNLDGSGNPIPLDFIMYQPLKILGTISSNENIGSSYTVNINPLTFRDALKSYLPISSPEIDLLNDNSINPTELFKTYILNNSSTFLTFYNEVKTKVEAANIVALEAVTPTKTYVTITDETLKTQLIKGSTYNSIAIEDMINTYMAYKVIYDARNSSTSSYSIFKKISSGTDTIVYFKYMITNEEYQGTVMYDKDGNLIDANYWQNYTDTDPRGGNQLSGYIKITKDGILSLRKGTFKLYTDNHAEGYVVGNVTVNNALTKFASASTNDNTISNGNAELNTTALPTEKIISSDLLGLWSGTYSVTNGICSNGSIDLTFANSSNSWQASDGTNIYGTQSEFDSITSIITLNNGVNIWSSDATLNAGKTAISGTWIDGTCNGTFTTTKQ